jgi:hypothetical protein
LSYCNRCGVKLESKERSPNKASDLTADKLVWAIVAVTVFGLGAVVAMLELLKQSPQFFGPIMAFAMLSLLLVVATEGVFLWLLLRSKKRAASGEEPALLRQSATKELEAGQMLGLPEPALSVTDQTTRILEPVPTGRKA